MDDESRKVKVRLLRQRSNTVLVKYLSGKANQKPLELALKKHGTLKSCYALGDDGFLVEFTSVEGEKHVTLLCFHAVLRC